VLAVLIRCFRNTYLSGASLLKQPIKFRAGVNHHLLGEFPGRFPMFFTERRDADREQRHVLLHLLEHAKRTVNLFLNGNHDFP
jgi:hypothetical protein